MEQASQVDQRWVAADLREKRDAALSATDWLSQRHADELRHGGNTTLTKAQDVELVLYRRALRALRDLPSVEGFPNVPLPPAPAFVK